MTPARQMQFWLVGLVLAVLVLYALRAVLLPFVAGMAIAYLCDPVADRLEKWRFPRTLATLTVIVGAILLFVLALLLVVPLLQAQTAAFIERLPSYGASMRGFLESLLGALQDRISAEQMEQLRRAAGEQLTQLPAKLGGLVGAVFSSGLALINLLSLIFITPIVAFYLLRDWDSMIDRLDQLLPRHQSETVKLLLGRMDGRLAGFVRGQLIVATILGVFLRGGVEFGRARIRLGGRVAGWYGVYRPVPRVGRRFHPVRRPGVAAVRQLAAYSNRCRDLRGRTDRRGQLPYAEAGW